MHYARLRNLREDGDMTQKQLAAKLHCGQRVYSNYERGDVDIPTEVLISLAFIYDTSIDYILELTDVEVPYARRA